MNQIIVSLIAGFIFGTGLSLSQMINPNKVLDFLDIMGNWDPSLALTMAGALAVTLATFGTITKRPSSILNKTFNLSARKDIDKPLLIGSSLFGIGWGMTGYCPGPAVASIGLGLSDSSIMVLSILLGFLAHKLIVDRRVESTE